MHVDAALVRERGVEFAVIVVKRHVLNNRHEASELISNLQNRLFNGKPVVLMSQDTRGVPTYIGRHDLVSFLARVPLKALPWRRYEVTLN